MSSLHYRGEDVLIHPPHQGGCGDLLFRITTRNPPLLDAKGKEVLLPRIAAGGREICGGVSRYAAGGCSPRKGWSRMKARVVARCSLSKSVLPLAAFSCSLSRSRLLAPGLIGEHSLFVLDQQRITTAQPGPVSPALGCGTSTGGPRGFSPAGRGAGSRSGPGGPRSRGGTASEKGRKERACLVPDWVPDLVLTSTTSIRYHTHLTILCQPSTALLIVRPPASVRRWMHRVADPKPA